MLNIGCHLSTSKGFKNMGKEALSIGANTFQFFTRNPRGGKAKDIDAKDVNELLEIMKKNNFATILAHAPYTLNGCSADENTRKFAIEMMADDLVRMEYLPNNFYNFHPDSAKSPLLLWKDPDRTFFYLLTAGRSSLLFYTGPEDSHCFPLKAFLLP